MVLEASFWHLWVHFGAIREAFGRHFDVFLGIPQIFANVCFTEVKHNFSRLGRVANGVLFVSVFRFTIFDVSFSSFCKFVGPRDPQRFPNRSLMATFRGHIWAEFLVLAVCGFQGGPRRRKGSIFDEFGLSLGSFLDPFEYFVYMFAAIRGVPRTSILRT